MRGSEWPGPSLDLDYAWEVVRQYLPVTPVWRLPLEMTGASIKGRHGSGESRAHVWAKLENLQETGSFKVRGALVKVSSLTPGERARGVVTCSSGNHGRAVAWVCERLGVRAVVCVPEWVDPVKLEAIQAHGAHAVVVGATYDEAAAHSVLLGERDGLVSVHPFDDVFVAAGQATVALEILEQVPDVGRVVIPLSGGGLAGGMAYALAERAPTVERVAASARRARVMWESLEAGHPIEMEEEETVASALSGGIELDNNVTFSLVRDHIETHVLVNEEDIRGSMAWAARQGVVVEGGGAVSLAAHRSGLLAPNDDVPTVLVLSGGNVSLDRLAAL